VGVPLHEDGLGLGVQDTLERLAEGLGSDPADTRRLETLDGLVRLARTLPFEVDFWKVQNAYYRALRGLYPDRRRAAEEGSTEARKWVDRFLALGERLSVRADPPDPKAP